MGSKASKITRIYPTRVPLQRPAAARPAESAEVLDAQETTYQYMLKKLTQSTPSPAIPRAVPPTVDAAHVHKERTRGYSAATVLEALRMRAEGRAAADIEAALGVPGVLRKLERVSKPEGSFESRT